jgi:tetratricopeptide (TPR) repeat protein
VIYGEEYWLGNMGKAYSRLGEPKKAIYYYEQALKISREIGNRFGEGTQLGNLGLVYTLLGKPKKAIVFLEKSLSIAKSIENPRQISFCEQILKGFEESED